MKSSFKVKIGDRFSHLVVCHVFRDNKITYCQCLCDCGNNKIVRYSNLHAKNTTSCGCEQRKLVGQLNKKPLGVAATNCIWNYYIRNARIRNLEWALSKDEFKKIIFANCFYCDIEPSNITKTEYRDYINSNGIDRIDSTKGYTLDNVVPACKTCNIAKNNLSMEQFKIWAFRLVQHLSQ